MGRTIDRSDYIIMYYYDNVIHHVYYSRTVWSFHTLALTLVQLVLEVSKLLTHHDSQSAMLHLWTLILLVLLAWGHVLSVKYYKVAFKFGWSNYILSTLINLRLPSSGSMKYIYVTTVYYNINNVMYSPLSGVVLGYWW